MELVVQGILLGGMYATAALGLSLVFGTIPVAVLVGLMAYPLQRYIFTPVMSQGEEAPITAAFGVSIAIETILLLIFTANPRSINASYATEQLNIFGVGVRVSLLIATVIGIAIVITLTLLLKRTQFGRQVRAASLDAEAAGLVGIDVKKTYARVMAISAATAAYGGVLVALSFSIAPSSGTGWLLRAFTVIVIGGLGSLSGTIYGGIIVGLVETFGAQIFGPQYRDLIVFGVLVLILIVRPNGLFSKVVKA
jgi:branched-chain amino acid transport system permease protein